MSLTAGAIAGLLGLSAGSSMLGGIIDSVGNYHINKQLMEEEMAFNANEAKLQRQFTDVQRQKQYYDNLGLMSKQLQNQQILDSAARAWQSNANRIAMDFSHDEAALQREFQQFLTSNAHQIEMADLKAAGLNPILAANFSGAAVPNGASGSGFSTSPSGSSASGSSVGLSSGSAASHSGAHAQARVRPFDAVTDFVGNYMSNAFKLAKMADKFDDDFYELAKARFFKDFK